MLNYQKEKMHTYSQERGSSVQEKPLRVNYKRKDIVRFNLLHLDPKEAYLRAINRKEKETVFSVFDFPGEYSSATTSYYQTIKDKRSPSLDRTHKKLLLALRFKMSELIPGGTSKKPIRIVYFFDNKETAIYFWFPGLSDEGELFYKCKHDAQSNKAVITQVDGGKTVAEPSDVFKF